jgi:mono/diheme cytochrome c family protein
VREKREGAWHKGSALQGPDGPPGLFDRLYSVAAWSVLVAMALVVAWLLWLVVTRTEPGTARRLAEQRVRPTQTALAELYAPEFGTARAPAVKVDLPVTCAACHTIAGTRAAGNLGPDLTHIGSTALDRLASADYHGAATTAAAYIRESILEPDAYVVSGAGWVTSAGISTMTAATGEALTPEELDRLVTYLASLQ